MTSTRRLLHPLSLSLLLLACAHAPPAQTVARPAAATAIDEDALRRAGIDPAALRCNSDNRWGSMLRKDSETGAAEMMALVTPKLAPEAAGEREALEKKLRRMLFWRMVRAVLIEGNNNNLGAFPLRGRTFVDASGATRPVLVFRSGITPDPDAPGSCFRSLIDGGVRHVVNLFDGEIPVTDLIDAEMRAAAQAGASYHTASDDPQGYGPWRELLRSHGDDPASFRRASEGVARLVREQILTPGGAPPRGHVHLHCGGGMHRSGMIAGIIERCINQEPMEVVEARYRYHVTWRSPSSPGGAEEGNLRFIREFDCKLLATP